MDMSLSESWKASLSVLVTPVEGRVATDFPDQNSNRQQTVICFNGWYLAAGLAS